MFVFNGLNKALTKQIAATQTLVEVNFLGEVVLGFEVSRGDSVDDAWRTESGPYV